MHYYQFNIGDYASHTRHLDLDEDLAYRRLLDMYYLHERPLNVDSAVVAKQIGMREKVQVVQDVLNEFFQLGEEGWVNDRADKEIKHFHSKIQQASRAGKASAERRSSARSTDVQPTNKQETINKNQFTVSLDTVSPPTGEPEENQSLKILGCDHKGVLALYHSTLPNLPTIEIWNDTRAGYLRQRWREVAIDLSKDGTVTHAAMLAWWKQFFEHIGSSKFLTGKTQSKDKPPFLADLEWVIKPTNFAKIIEGKYHRD
jgi:uncharacterized protein YdaU (DUF1376 family)